MSGKMFTTTNAGAPVPSDQYSKTIGPDGPVVLHDVHLVKKLAQFNRERVPERVVHAKGGGLRHVDSHTRYQPLHPGRAVPAWRAVSALCSGPHKPADALSGPG